MKDVPQPTSHLGGPLTCQHLACMGVKTIQHAQRAVEKNHCRSSAGSTAQCAAGFLTATPSYSHSTFSIVQHGFILPKVQKFPLHSLHFQEASASPFACKSSPQQHSHPLEVSSTQPTLFRIICRHAEGVFHPRDRVIYRC